MNFYHPVPPEWRKDKEAQDQTRRSTTVWTDARRFYRDSTKRHLGFGRLIECKVWEEGEVYDAFWFPCQHEAKRFDMYDFLWSDILRDVVLISVKRDLTPDQCYRELRMAKA